MKQHDVHEPISPDLIAHLRPLVSLTILLIPVLASIPPLPKLLAPVRLLFSDHISLESLISQEYPTREEEKRIEGYGLRLWRQIVLVGGGLVGLVGWTVVFGMSLVAAIQGEEGVIDVLAAAGMMLVWMNLFSQPLFQPPSTPPWAATLVYVLLWLSSVGALSLATFLRASNGHFPHWAGPFWLSFELVTVAITSLLLYVVGGLPLATPESLARLEMSPDDLVTPLTWLSFSWVDPFIRLGNSKELQPEDLPNLSLTQQCAHVFRSFNDIKTSSLLRKIFWANRLDLFMDASLTLASVIFNYAGPFFLKRILDGLTDRSPRAMSQAYMYTFLALTATTLKAITDLVHLWHGRRATVRMKAELIAAVYDKALRRKDASGVVTKAAVEPDAKGGKKADVKEEKKTNADSGKVVNLMAGDTNRVANTVAGAYYIYSAPFELIVASTFLYNILGWSAFAGVVILVVAVPLNSYVSKRSIKITQDLLKARDGRIGVMNELIGAITFIKFFAWGAQWKARASQARAQEMKQMIRSLINGVYFSMLWALAPIFVTLVSFFCYIVIAKRDLTVSVAFTAISLFSMLRMPLNVIPTYVVIVLQAHVSVKRIEDFLGEDEVPEWVSSLKRSSEPPLVKTKISFENASFSWNTGKQADAVLATPGSQPAKTVTATSEPSSPTTSTATSTAVTNSDPNSDTEDLTPALFTLSDLNVNFPLGKLTVITGPTGSGKTAILTALLGEMELLSGSSHLPKYTQQVDKRGLRNSIAYASQTAWLQQKSIRENILFGEKMDEGRYETVLEACALLPDLDVLADGDQTEIGAKGVSLSGGQKARVALARAVYSYTQHLLLDDPLAAVDSHTAKHLTDYCLNGSILKGRTVLLVSHHVELLLPSADYLIRILDGRIDAQGTPADLRARGELDGLVAMEEAEITKEEPVTVDSAIDDEMKVVEEDKAEDKKGTGMKKAPGKKFVQDEERSVGNVKWETYKLYIVAATYITWAWSLAILVFAQVFAIGERYWLKIWGQGYLISSTPAFFSFSQSASGFHQQYHGVDVHQHFLHAVNATTAASTTLLEGSQTSWPFHDLPPAHTHPAFYLAVYSGIVIGTALLGVLSNVMGSWGQYRAAVNLHNRLLDTVMSGTIRFFNVTPVGRILNRFSKDIETIDSSLNSGLRTVIVYVASLLGALITVAVIVPWFLLPAAIISWLYFQYSVLYVSFVAEQVLLARKLMVQLRVGRSLRRLEAISRSPIYSGFAELLDGVISVRAFSAEARFMNQLCEQVDKMHSAFYYYWMMNRWLLLRFDILGGVSVGLTTLFALTGAVDPGSAGMAILSAQSFVSACYWVSRFWGQLEMDFNAVERVQEYLVNIPQEPPAIISSCRPPAYWPSSTPSDPETFLSVRDLEIKYAPDLPTVFSGSFDVKAGEKIGLIGRTGSGKSTLAMSLLRFCEPTQGGIWLDGIDITSIGVDDLRSRITYIPQDAVLFSGTVRMNLDPFDQHTDEELMDALARVNLGSSDNSPAPSRVPSRAPSSNRLAALAAADSKLTTKSTTSILSAASSSTPATRKQPSINLTTEVSSGGANFSQGQRQLVAMARALLRRSNLIIMDEATASVDFATDESIQSAIRSEFGGSTLITIAHRLSSVIDYDRLLVLADGKVAEFDTPINLLRKETSLFKNLCEKSGKYRDLYRAAEKKEKGGLLVDV